MKIARRARARGFVALAIAVAACDDNKPVATTPSASASINEAPPAPPPREGCARTGTFAALENDPACVTKHATEEAMRAAMKRVAINVALEPAEVITGNTALMTITMTNTSPAEATIFLEARPRPIGPRTDWSRVIGIPEPKNTTSEVPRLFFPLTTTDSWDHDVDSLPVVNGSTTLPPPPVTTLAVHLRPSGKLTHTASWWALRIPAPAPVFQDDAGHRYYPKTAAVSLIPGEYTITVELPLFGLTREERRYTTRVRVVRAPKPSDGGL